MRASTLLIDAVADHRRLHRQVGGQRLDRALGLALLHERQSGVEQDHHHDRHREDARTADRREDGGEPQQQGQGVGELPNQLTQPALPVAG